MNLAECVNYKIKAVIKFSQFINRDKFTYKYTP